MANSIGYLVSDEYRKEALRLAQDPIVVQLEKELPQDIDLDSFNFMQAANWEYEKRGGKGAESVGGVVEAIKEIRRKK